MTAALRVLDSPEAIGEDIASQLLERIARAQRDGRRFLLGCPTGRTPRPIYASMARRVAERQHDLSALVLVMMDEYLVRQGDRFAYVSSEAPWSCHRFVRTNIVEPLNAGLPASHRLREEAVWFPDPLAPGTYDSRIDDAGGIDFFLLASGASDGHVAFNPPGTSRDSRTRVVELSEQTRRDNLKTFPELGSLDAVPRHGVSVGIATIRAAREAVMVVWGAAKRLTLECMVDASAYDPSWPATVIHEFPNGEIVADTAAGEGTTSVR